MINNNGNEKHCGECHYHRDCIKYKDVWLCNECLNTQHNSDTVSKN